MSDAQKLKEAIADYRKANKELDDKLKAIEEKKKQAQPAQTD